MDAITIILLVNSIIGWVLASLWRGLTRRYRDMNETLAESLDNAIRMIEHNESLMPQRAVNCARAGAIGASRILLGHIADTLPEDPLQRAAALGELVATAWITTTEIQSLPTAKRRQAWR